jgi:uncharacterized membrane protein YfcA
MMFDLAAAVLGTIAGAIAAVSGFGIGSLLTPLLAWRYDTKVAVALVSVPHFVGTVFRLVGLWNRVDRRVLVRFGMMSAAGGLAGALLQARANSPALTIVFAVLLLFAGVSQLVGLGERMRFGGTLAWIAGAVSGFFGGLVGNQGGIRSAALMGFALTKEEFVATATAIGVIVDVVRLPVYLATQGGDMRTALGTLLSATVGVLVGTFWGVRALRRIPEPVFRRGVAALIVLLGVYMLLRGIAGSA